MCVREAILSSGDRPVPPGTGDPIPKSRKAGIMPLTKRSNAVRIKIEIGPLSTDAELNDSPTAKKIADSLPLNSPFNTWGEEIYFTLPVEADLDDTAREEVAPGDLGYWPTGRAFCIFFGETPGSPPGKIIPASAVNIIGRVLGDATRFRTVMGEKVIRVTPAPREVP